MPAKTIGVVGLGLMGRGIATVFLANDLQVIAVDPNEESQLLAHEHIEASFAELPSAKEFDWRSRFSVSSEYHGLAPCEFVVESIPEEPALKQDVLKRIEAVVNHSVPIATNTSALPISMLQSACKAPARIIGMHWAEPCHLTRFLEVIRGEQTDDNTTQATIELGTRVGKDPTVVQRDVPGFIVNRLAYAMYREAFWLVENGVADVETVDRAFVNAISVWADIAGPFRWMDMTGLPAYAQAMERLFPELNCQRTTPRLMQELIDSGAKGTANGRGFYDYSPEEARQWRARWVANARRTSQLLESQLNSSQDNA